ncbi:hypothetical protein SPHV1_2160020 [Novosphingobium sp. KN65.2]|nr:hypothetical protein SPHV1_2160020 [Novosphingobium sp. KN65.2]
MPLGIEAAEAFRRAVLEAAFHLFSDCLQFSLFRRGRIAGKVACADALQSCARAVELADFGHRSLSHRSAAVLFDFDQTFRGKALQCLANFEAAAACFADDVDFHQPLPGDEAAGADLVAYPVRDFRAGGTLSRKCLGDVIHAYILRVIDIIVNNIVIDVFLAWGPALGKHMRGDGPECSIDSTHRARISGRTREAKDAESRKNPSIDRGRPARRGIACSALPTGRSACAG